MTWVYIFINLLIGIIIGMIVMYYKNRNLLHHQKTIHNELQNNKIKLHKYQQELNNHFTHNIELLDKMADNYRQLYHNIKKSANFFLPNIHIQDNLYTTVHSSFKKNVENEQLPIEAPRDYSDNIRTKHTKKNNNNIK